MKKLHIVVLILLCSLLSLGQLQRVSLQPVTALYIHDVVISSWVILLIVSNFKKVVSFSSRLLQSFLSNKLLTTLFLLVLTGWLGALASNNFPTWTILYTVRLLTYLAWATLLYKLKPISKNWLLLCFISTGLLIALFGLLQYFFIPDVRSLSILGWDDHFYRLVSTQLDPNFTGLLLIITMFWLWSLPFSFWQWLIHGLTTKQLKTVQQLVTYIGSGILLVGVGLTFSRSTFLALTVSLAIFAFTKVIIQNQTKKVSPQLSLSLLAVVAVVLLTLLAAPKPDGEGVKLWRTRSAYARIVNISNWVYSLEPYQLVIGRGLFVPPPQELLAPTGIAADHANLPDNFFVLVLSGIGIPGVAMLIILLGRIVQTLKIDSYTWAILTSILTHSLFNNSLLQAFILLFLLGKIIEVTTETKQ